MSQSLDEIVEWILGEIVYSGIDGITVAQFLKLVARYYTTHQSAAESHNNAAKFDNGNTHAPVDHELNAAVWRALVSHDDTYVGADRIGNSLSLDEAEALPLPPPDLVRASRPRSRPIGESEEIKKSWTSAVFVSPGGDAVNHRNSDNDEDDSIIVVDNQTTQGPGSSENKPIAAKTRGRKRASSSKKSTKSAITKYNSSSPASHSFSAPHSFVLRYQPLVKASPNRMWTELAGHVLDYTRVTIPEWIVLCTIGAARENGVDGKELEEISGQDHLDVSYCCDSLLQKGYIVKRQHATAMSSFYLKRFAHARESFSASESIDHLNSEGEAIMNESQSHSMPRGSSTQLHDTNSELEQPRPQEKGSEATTPKRRARTNDEFRIKGQRGRPKKIIAHYTSHEDMLRQDGHPGVYRDIIDYERGKIEPANPKSRSASLYICFKSEKLKSLPWMHQKEVRPFVAIEQSAKGFKNAVTDHSISTEDRTQHTSGNLQSMAGSLPSKEPSRNALPAVATPLEPGLKSFTQSPQTVDSEVYQAMPTVSPVRGSKYTNLTETNFEQPEKGNGGYINTSNAMSTHGSQSPNSGTADGLATGLLETQASSAPGNAGRSNGANRSIVTMNNPEPVMQVLPAAHQVASTGIPHPPPHSPIGVYQSPYANITSTYRSPYADISSETAKVPTRTISESNPDIARSQKKDATGETPKRKRGLGKKGLVTESIIDHGTPVNAKANNMDSKSTSQPFETEQERQSREAKVAQEAQDKAAMEIRAAAEKKAADDLKFQQDIERAQKVTIPGVTHRVSVTLCDAPGNLYISKERDLVIFDNLKNPELQQTIKVCDIAENPTTTKEGSDPMFISITIKNLKGEKAVNRFRFLPSAEEFAAANEVRAKIVLAIISLQLKGQATPPEGSDEEEANESKKRDKRFKCAICNGSWLNAEGLKYHLTKAKVACNPSYVPPPPKPESAKKSRVTKRKSPVPGSNSTDVDTVNAADNEHDTTQVEAVGNKSKKRRRQSSAQGSGGEDNNETTARSSPVSKPKRTKVATESTRSSRRRTQPAPVNDGRPSSSTNNTPALENLELHDKGQIANESSAQADIALEQELPVARPESPPYENLPAPETTNSNHTTSEPPDISKMLEIDWQKSKKHTVAETRIHREIIMSIVEQNGGAFPGKRGIWYAFCRELFRRNPAEKLQRFVVCNAAVNSLAGSGRLQKIEFNFKSTRGGSLVRQVLALRGVDPVSQKVLEIKEKIKEYAPDHYCPPEWSLPQNVKAKLDALEGNFAYTGKNSPFKNAILQNPVVIAPPPRRLKTPDPDADFSSTVAPSSTTRSARGRNIIKPVRLLEQLNSQEKTGTADMSDGDWREDYLDDNIGDNNEQVSTTDASRMMYETVVENASDINSQFPLSATYMQDPRSSAWSVLLKRSQFHGISEKAIGPKTRRRLVQRPATNKSPSGTKWKRKASFISDQISLERPAKRRRSTVTPKDISISMLDFKPRIDHLQNPNTGVSSLPSSFFENIYDTNREVSLDTFLSVLPQSLTRILQVSGSPNGVQLQRFDGMDESLDTDVDCVAEWEQILAPDLLQSSTILPGSIFVNHITTNTARRQTPVKLVDSIWSDVNNFTVDTLPYHELEAIELEEENTTHGTKASVRASMRDGPKRRVAKKPPLVHKPRISDTQALNESPELWIAYKQRYSTVLPTDLEGIPKEFVKDFRLAEVDTDHMHNAYKRRTRVPTMTLEHELLLVVAVVVIRTLAGGIDKTIDWVIVTSLFPGYSMRYTMDVWPRMAEKYKDLVQKLSRDFPTLYLEAYQNNEVDSIDFDNLLEYDWEDLVEWVKERVQPDLDSAVQRLPMSRTELERSGKIIDIGRNVDRDSYYEWNRPVHKRMDAMSVQPYVTSPRKPSTSTEPISQLEIAKSWARANTMTRDEDFHVKSAAKKLAQIPSRIMTAALDDLTTSKLLVRNNKGRPVPGRGFHISDAFDKSMKQQISRDMINQAANFKRLLDDAFAKGEAVEIPWAADEGTIMAVTNLQAYGRISMMQKGVPMEKMGMLDGQYTNRFMDKKKMIFGLSVAPTTRYIEDRQNPILQTMYDGIHSAPKAVDEALPIWIDINGNLMPEVWRTVLLAVTSIVCMRTGVTIADIERILKPSVGAWEVRLLLEWCASIGMIEQCIPGIDGWTVSEWWWLAVGKA